MIRELASALNPTVNFQLNDVRRLPFDRVEHSDRIVAQLRETFADHEAANELSLEYREPAPSHWESAQRWAQACVDRAAGEPLPPYEAIAEPPAASTRISHALGFALGRFAAAEALPDGILFLGPTSGSLQHAACERLRDTWSAQHAGRVHGDGELSTYLRHAFFAEHRRHYESRPIYFPLSSAKRTFVAYVCFHGLRSNTLSNLVADHLVAERRNLEGRLADLREARRSGAGGETERRFVATQKLLEELNDFLAKVTELAERGPPPADAKTRTREVDARYEVDPGDGILMTAAGLWPLLDPQWKEPKKLWKEVANATGKKEYDWAHLAARYFPARVREKCRADASLTVAHGCFWELHPREAYGWERRLQCEIGAGFTLDEQGADAARARFMTEQPADAAALAAKERKRHEKTSAEKERGATGPLFEEHGAG